MEDLIRYLGAGSPEELSDRLGQLDDDLLEAVTVGLQDLARRVEATLVHGVAELDRRAVPDRRYALSTKQWLRRFCRRTASEASATVTVARTLRSMPNVAKRAMAGDIPVSGLRQIARIARRHPDEFPLHEEVFADIAGSLDARDLRRAIDHWRQQVDHGEVVADADHRRAQRRASIAQTTDRMWHLEGLLDPESGRTIATAMRAHADPANLDPQDDRSYPQRMADGLTEIARRSLDRGGDRASGGERPHLTVTVSYDHLTDTEGDAVPLPEIDGTPVRSETIRRLACDARIVRMVLDGEGQPLDVGRAVRTVTPAIRRALDARDGGCAWSGCDLPPAWCDAHHIEHWADGGPTSLENLQLLCRRHHGVVHEGGDPHTGRRAPPDR